MYIFPTLEFTTPYFNFRLAADKKICGFHVDFDLPKTVQTHIACIFCVSLRSSRNIIDEREWNWFASMHLRPLTSFQRCIMSVSLLFYLSFEWSVNEDEVPKRTLEVIVKNDVSFFSRSKTTMGRVSVCSVTFYYWFALYLIISFRSPFWLLFVKQFIYIFFFSGWNQLILHRFEEGSYKMVRFFIIKQKCSWSIVLFSNVEKK